MRSSSIFNKIEVVFHFVFHISSSWVDTMFHTKYQHPKLPSTMLHTKNQGLIGFTNTCVHKLRGCNNVYSRITVPSTVRVLQVSMKTL